VGERRGAVSSGRKGRPQGEHRRKDRPPINQVDIRKQITSIPVGGGGAGILKMGEKDLDASYLEEMGGRKLHSDHQEKKG